MDQLEIRAIVECLIFAAEKPLTVEEIAMVADLLPMEVDQAIKSLTADCEQNGRGVALREVAGGYRFYSKKEYASYLEKLASPSPTKNLSSAALETLAVIAYQQPVTRLEIEAIRGVKSDRTIYTLLDRGLIEEAGRLEVVGRPITYATTPQFLELSGIVGLNELPPLEKKSQME